MSEKKQRELRVRCLVLDHDDTVVKSTPEINFPAFLRSLKDLRGTTMSYEQFVEYNFDPGFYEMCADICTIRRRRSGIRRQSGNVRRQ